MTQHYISKLFYGKYPYKLILINNSTKYDIQKKVTRQIKEWLDINAPDSKTYMSASYSIVSKGKRGIVKKITVFLKDEQELQKFKRKFKKLIIAEYIPYNDKHIETLKDNVNMIVRQDLVYKKFRYILIFAYDNQGKNQELWEWLNTNLLEDLEGDECRWYRCGGYSRIYLTDDKNLAFIKLAWLDKITGIRYIRTYDEMNEVSE